MGEIKTMQENVKFYVEIENEIGILMQSREFDFEWQAIAWYRNNFDYVNTDEIRVSLMRITHNIDDTPPKSQYLYDITCKCYLKGE